MEQPRHLSEKLLARRWGISQADADVLLVEPFSEFPDGNDFASGIAVGCGISAVSDRRDDCDGAIASLLAGEDRAWAEAHPAWPAPGAILSNIALASARQDAKAKARNIVVPEEILDRSHIGGVDQSFCQFWHRDSPIPLDLLPAPR